jgi:hypothetical protein
MTIADPFLEWCGTKMCVAYAPRQACFLRVLHLRKGSFASKYLQLFVGFYISAAMHGMASMLCERSFQDDGGWYGALMTQAIAIMVEDHVIKLGRYLGLRPSIFWKLVGCVWVILWLGWSMRGQLDVALDRGMWIHHRIGDFLGLSVV